MDKPFRDVMQFHRACGAPIGTLPEFPDPDRLMLRLSMNDEEEKELNDAVQQRCLESVADAIADKIYVLIGMAIEFGIDLPSVWKRVQDANVAKASGPRREDGKILKPAGWQPPNVREVLESQLSIQELY